jgi:hypothetical protein
MLVNSGGKFQPLKIIPIVIPTRIYTAAGTVRLEHVYSIPRLSGAKQLQSARGKKLLAHISTLFVPLETMSFEPRDAIGFMTELAYCAA